MLILGVSSVNVRAASRLGKDRAMEPVCFECSVCHVRRWLGRTTSAFVRLQCMVDGRSEEWLLCGRCLDVVVDMARFGPRVLLEGYKWRLCSRVVRVSLVEERLVCLRCWTSADSHLFVKYDNLLVGGNGVSYAVGKICDRCVFSFIDMMRKEDRLRTFSFPLAVGSVVEG